MDFSPTYGPPASHFPESMTPGARSGHDPDPPLHAVSPPANGTASSDSDLLQDIARAIEQRRWHFIPDQIMKRGPNSYENLAGTALRFVIYAMKSNCNQEASILDTVKALVEMAPSEDHRDAIVNRTRFEGKTPLHLLVSFPCEDTLRIAVVDYLLGHGAIATIRDNNGRTALHLAAETLYEGNTGIAIFDSLLRHGAVVTAQDNKGQTPLHLAAATPWEGDNGVAIFDFLLRHGADVTAQDNKGQTPLHLAAATLCEGNIRALINHVKEKGGKLYDNNLIAPLDCALAACQNRTADTAEAVDRTKLYNSVSEECQRCIKLLEGYQNERRRAPEPKCPNWNKYYTSSACMSSIFVMGQHPPAIGVSDGQITTTRDWITLNRPVTEVLDGQESVMKEVRRRNKDFSSQIGYINFGTETKVVPGLSAMWIHLPTHNVGEFKIPS